MLKQLTHSLIALLPNVDHPTKIALLCSIAYKVVSKILAGRLKMVLPKLISPFQAAFMPGQTIQDNAILGQEVLHSMKSKRGRKGWCAVKVDMEKAYDHMEWGFILKVLRLFGFHTRWVVWIQQCISTVSFSVLLNGAPFGFFSPERGLRQGYPLSPFLFILGSEVLSRFLIREENTGVYMVSKSQGVLLPSHT